jgi:8-oxo-dGTP pyrophosphatase MutT (NUDIX family)
MIRYYSGALIFTDTEEIVLQLRDNITGLFDAGKISTFGGRGLAGEDAKKTLKRELHEELGFEVEEDDCKYIGSFFHIVNNIETECRYFALLNQKQDFRFANEGAIIMFNSIEEACRHKLLADGCRFALNLYKQNQVH